MSEGTLTNIVIALHVSAVDAVRIVNTLAIHTDDVPSREASWKHVRRSTKDLTLVFGPAGLKRVRATNLVNQLSDTGFRYTGCVLAVRYTDDADNPKLSLEFPFENKPELGLAPQTIHLGEILHRLVWRRGRVLLLRQGDGSLTASVELAQPKASSSSRITELEYDRILGFCCRRNHLPTS